MTSGHQVLGEGRQARARVLMAVCAGPWAWRGVGLARRLLDRGIEVCLRLGPGMEGWVPRRTFAVAVGPDRLSGEGAAAESVGRVGAVIVAGAGPEDLAALAQGVGWVADLAPIQGPRIVLEAEAEPPAWVAGPREALRAMGAVLVDATRPEADLVAAIAEEIVPRDLDGWRVVITAGPSREYLDPVRFLSNPSSGRMGVALARAAWQRGASVDLCLGPVEAQPPGAVRVHRFVSAEDLDALVQALGPEADLVVAAAAVADWRPAQVSEQKVKKQGDRQTVELLRTPDVIARLARVVRGRADRPLLVGFAAETEAIEANARAKLAGKGLDLVVANRVAKEGGAFGAAASEALLVDAGGVTRLPRLEKIALAHRILSRARGLASTNP